MKTTTGIILRWIAYIPAFAAIYMVSKILFTLSLKLSPYDLPEVDRLHSIEGTWREIIAGFTICIAREWVSVGVAFYVSLKVAPSHKNNAYIILATILSMAVSVSCYYYFMSADVNSVGYNRKSVAELIGFMIGLAVSLLIRKTLVEEEEGEKVISIND